MKIIRISNFDLEIPEYVMVENLTEDAANKLCDDMCAAVHERSPYYYRVVPDEYKPPDSRTNIRSMKQYEVTTVITRFGTYTFRVYANNEQEAKQLAVKSIEATTPENYIYDKDVIEAEEATESQ